MDFDEIKSLVACDKDLPTDATLTDQYAYEVLKSLNMQYKNKAISKDRATKSKKELIRRYTDQKKLDENKRENWDKQVKNINRSEEIRVRLNKACKEGIITKELFLDAIECISLMCGDTLHFKSCQKQLEGVEYEEATD